MVFVVTTDDGKTLFKSQVDDEEVLELLRARLDQGFRGRVAVGKREATPDKGEPAVGEELMTAKDAAAWLGIPLASFYQAVAEGDIPHLRLGARRIRVRRSDLLTFMEQRAKQSIAQ